MLCKKIVKFILKHKFNLSESHYLYLANQMEDILKLNKVIFLIYIQILEGIKFLLLIKYFDVSF